MQEVARIHAEQKISFGLRYRGPDGHERDDLIHLNIGDPVLVYRDTSTQWEGPFRFVALDGDTVTVELPNGRENFRSTVVKTAPKERNSELELSTKPSPIVDFQYMLSAEDQQPRKSR
jgi:hypothetical protein